MVWSDDECDNIGGKHLGTTGTLEQCKDGCLAKNECTAINYSPDHGCTFRKCGQPVPDPEWDLNKKGKEQNWLKRPFNGYYMVGGGNIK